MPPLLILIFGLTILTLGAELLVRGAAALALRLGLTPLVVGLTVVAFGTSAPELVVSLQAAQRGAAAMAVGNVIGSNICNLALILGLCALLRPLTTDRSIIWREVPILIGATAAVALILVNGLIGRGAGVALLLGLVGYTVITLIRARQDPNPDLGHDAPRPLSLPLSLAFALGGLVLLLYGSDRFVTAAVDIARQLEWSETLIGLTIVAVSTSLPELAISVVAVKNGEADVAIGNVVGSSLFNLLGILGTTALAAGTIAVDLHPGDLIMLIVLTLALWPLVQSGHRIDRREGAALLAAYLLYTSWLVISRSPVG
jgi:cation:H+ antiporter